MLIFICQAAQCNISDPYHYDQIRDADQVDCPDIDGATISFSIYVIYIMFLNIMLINLLIAIFK
jgi:hypothetical protein